jgi:hypothetical protein
VSPGRRLDAIFKFEYGVQPPMFGTLFKLCSHRHQWHGDEQMPRIPREEHAAIRHRVDVAGQKVAEVAAAYGCTPANIYAILARLRRQDDQDTGGTAPHRRGNFWSALLSGFGLVA